MALEDIFRALEEQAEADCREIVDAARDQADAIAEEAEEQAAEIRKAQLELAEREVRAESAQRLNAARLGGRKLIAGVKDRAIAFAFDGAAEKLAAVAGTAAYDAVFAALAEEALAGVEGEVEAHVRKADKELAERVLGKLGARATVVADLDATGGIVVAASGGRIYRRNTFEDRLARMRESGQAEVAEILFA